MQSDERGNPLGNALPKGNGYKPVKKRRQPMFNFIKKLFKKSEKTTVYKHGKAYRFNTFEKALAFMLL